MRGIDRAHGHTAELSKHNAEKTAEAAKQLAEKSAEAAKKVDATSTTSSVVKTDSVQISTAAQKASGTTATKDAAASNTATSTAAADKTNAAADKASSTSTASTTAKSDTVQISEKASTLAGTAKADTTSNATAAKDTATHATQTDAKVEATTQHSSTVDKATATDQPQSNRELVAEKKVELKHAVNDLKDIGTGKSEIKAILKTAKKEANASVNGDIKQLSADYRAHNIDRSEMKDRMYGIAAKQLDGVISNVKDVYNQKTGFINNNESTQAPRESIFTKTADTLANSAPSEKATADKTSIIDKAIVENKEKSEEAKAAAQAEDKTAMAAKPTMAAKPKISETKTNIAENVGDHLTTTTEKTVENSALKTGNTNPGEKSTGIGSNNGNEKANSNGPGNGNGNGLGNGPGQVGQAEKAEKAEKSGNSGKNEGMSKLEKALKEILKEILKSEKSGTPSGLEKKSEGPGNSENASEKIASMFNDVDKMVKDLDKEDAQKGFGDFVSGLKDMFSSGNGIKGNSFLQDLNKVVHEHGASDAHKVGMATIKAETLSGLLKGGNTNSAFGINRIGDNGEGSGNFSAVNFMSDLSDNVNEGLDSYKDAKEARENAGVNGEAAAKAGAEAEFSVLV